MHELEDNVARLSNAVSLTVLEIDCYPNELIPAFLLANLMSPALWAWRSEKNVHDRDKALLLYTLLQHSIIAGRESVIVFSDKSSFVSYKDEWIDLGTLVISKTRPSDLIVIFDARGPLCGNLR